MQCNVGNEVMEDVDVPDGLLMTNIKCADYPRVTVGPENPIRVERDETAELYCEVPFLSILINFYQFLSINPHISSSCHLHFYSVL